VVLGLLVSVQRRGRRAGVCLVDKPEARCLIARSEGRDEPRTLGAAQRAASRAMAAVSVAAEARKPKQAWSSDGLVGAEAASVVMKIVSRASGAGWAQSHS
jgi:hypothetical protein